MNATIEKSQAIAPVPQLDTAKDVLMYSLSDASKRQYDHTFKLWDAYAHAQDFPRSEMTAQNIIGFLEASDISHSTKQSRLTHLRVMLKTLHAQQPDNVQIESMYKQVQLLKPQRSKDAPTGHTREKHALKPVQVVDAFRIWNGDTNQHVRNRALLAVLFYAGLRRSEAVALKWSDIDLEGGLLTVRHGKGDKPRTIPLLADAVPYIAAWKARCEYRVYVFCGLVKGGAFKDDAPISPDGLYYIIKRTSAQIGVDIAPHDARRTLITNALAAGTSVSDAQFIAGHENPQTTLAYADVKDANEVRGRVKLNY